MQKRILLAGIFTLALCWVPLQAAYADDPDHCGSAGVGEANVVAYVPGPPDLYILEQPFANRSGVATVGEYIQLMYSYAAGLIGIIAVVLIMAGGIMWIAAGGNEQTIGTAKEIIVSALTAVIIMVLSFAILRIINPTLVTQKLTVPEIPIKGCATPDGEVTSIPSHKNLTGSGQLCPGATAALVQIADNMALTCPDCKIGIGSTYRSSDSQEPLYACYQAAVEAGYFASDGKTKIKSGCPDGSGCSGCNLAAKPCCSNHRQGTAADLWFEYSGTDGSIAKTSQGKLAQEHNNGGGDAALQKNQQMLKTYMEATIGGRQLFKGISAEWWHFDYKGDCGTAGVCSVVQPADGFSDAANNTYCKSTTTDSTGKYLYRHASCVNGDATCQQGFGGYNYLEISDGTCSGSSSTYGAYGGGTTSKSYYSFTGMTGPTTPTHTFYTPPTCKTQTTSSGSTACPFVTVQTSPGIYEVDNNILPQSEDYPGNEDITDIYKLNHTPLLDDSGLYNLQVKEWEREKSYIDHVNLLKLPKQGNAEYAVTPSNEIVSYTPGKEAMTRCMLNNGVDCAQAAAFKDAKTVPGIPGDKVTLQFNSVEDYSNLGLLISAQGRDRATLDIAPKGPLSSLANKLINFIIPSANAKLSLHVYIKKQSGDWEKISELHPRELPADFELLNLGELNNLPDNLEVQLVWTGYHVLDSVQIVEMEPLTEDAQVIPLTSATHSVVGDVTGSMSTIDTEYMTLIPREQVDLTFKDSDSTTNPKDFVYFFQSTGHYYTLD